MFFDLFRELHLAGAVVKGWLRDPKPASCMAFELTTQTIPNECTGTTQTSCMAFELTTQTIPNECTGTTQTNTFPKNT
ncbi:UNVERIFIED_CONTAM: hypothetical protein FKN15_065238 [Acipenser sinensis]